MDTEPPMSLHDLHGHPTQPPPHQATNMLQNEAEVIRLAGRQAIVQFLEQHNCFAVLRNSGKVVVFDTRIPIQLAFYALVEHDMLAAPLWDPIKCQFVGLLTVTDFIDILREFKNTGANVADLATHSIANILTATRIAPPADSSGSQQQSFGAGAGAAGSRRPFCGADASCSLKQACQQLLSGHDFLPIVFTEDMRVLACITYTNILEHLVTHFREQRRLFDDSITDLGIGTYGDAVVTVHGRDSLARALELMYRHNLSALPVMDEATNKAVGVYSRSDITFLTKATDAEDAVRNLDLPLEDILAQHRQDVTTPDALRTCSPSHTLQAIFESFAQLRFNRLYVVDEAERLLGVVSAKDLVKYFLMDAVSE